MQSAQCCKKATFSCSFGGYAARRLKPLSWRGGAIYPSYRCRTLNLREDEHINHLR
jgi:hypothetical protein